jgi:shikimate dehydrogenase
MKVNKETQVCISIAETPGSLGATIFNNAFEKMSLNYIYKPFKVDKKDLQKAILGIRAFGIRGCGVSMPHKITVMKYLDGLDRTARLVGAANTIVNTKGKLIGYNTDFDAVKIMTKTDFNVKGAYVLIAGAGGVARSIILAVRENKAANITITNRDDERGKKLAKSLGVAYLIWKDRDTLRGDLIVNATPLGMGKGDVCAFANKSIKNFKAVLDVIVSVKDTPLLKVAKKYKKVILRGVRMSSLQAAAQFKLYTGLELPASVIEKSIGNFLRSK